MLPRDINAHGTIFGGVILSHIDLAGAICRFSASAEEFRHPSDARSWFYSPGLRRGCMSFYTGVLREGTTSVTVQVIVEAERSKEPRRQAKVTEAEVIYVAVDEDGNPTIIR
jgi:acyl-CoA thioesterase YciA